MFGGVTLANPTNHPSSKWGPIVVCVDLEKFVNSAWKDWGELENSGR